MKTYSVQTGEDTYEGVAADRFEIEKSGVVTFWKSGRQSYLPDELVIAYNPTRWLTFFQDDTPPEPEKPKSNNTWPEDCPVCHAPWKMRSKTMGAAHGQPHQGTCLNDHRWYEDGIARCARCVRPASRPSGTCLEHESS